MLMVKREVLRECFLSSLRLFRRLLWIICFSLTNYRTFVVSFSWKSMCWIFVTPNICSRFSCIWYFRKIESKEKDCKFFAKKILFSSRKLANLSGINDTKTKSFEVRNFLSLLKFSLHAPIVNYFEPEKRKKTTLLALISIKFM